MYSQFESGILEAILSFMQITDIVYILLDERQSKHSSKRIFYGTAGENQNEKRYHS